MAEEDDRVVLLATTDGSDFSYSDFELRTAESASAAAESSDQQQMRQQQESSSDGSKSNGNHSRRQRSGPEADREPAAIVYFAAVTAAVGGLLFGYDMGVISGAKTPMQRELGLSCSQLEMIVAFLPVGAFFASLVGGAAVDNYGRRLTIVLNAFLFTLGALILSLTSSYALLLMGRFILGFAVSLSAIAECIYISELSTPEKRGMLVSLNELGITVGILVAFLVNYIFADTAGGWRFMFGLSSVVAVGQGVVMIFMPRTPQFLMIKRKEEKAEKTLRDLRLTTNVRQTMADIRLALADERADGSFASKLCANADNICSRLFIGLGLVFFQQFTGQPNIIYYANDVFRDVGFCTEFSSTLATVGLGLMKVLSTVISLALVDRIGRRKALFGGITVMLVSVLSLAVFAFYQQGMSEGLHTETCTEVTAVNNSLSAIPTQNATVEDHLFVSADNSSTLKEFVLRPLDVSPAPNDHCEASKLSGSMRGLAFVALVGFVCSYSFSFGPITWVVLSEIFPASTKGRAMALATAANWLGNIIVSATFLEATSTFTLGGVFSFYVIMCAFAIVFVFLVVPETKGRSLEEISKELKSKNTKSLMRDNAATNFCCWRGGGSDRERRRRDAGGSSNYSPLHFTI